MYSIVNILLIGSLNVDPITPESQRSLDMDSECSEKKYVFVVLHKECTLF